MIILDLCMAFGKTQKQILNSVDGLDRDDLVEWMAYQRIKPFGYDEERRRIGMICATICNSSGKSFKETLGWEDFFMPSWEDPKKEEKKGKFDLDLLLHIFKSVAVPKESQEEKQLKEET